MPPLTTASLLQILLGLGLLNVWLLRAASETRYRGARATTLRQEFSAYGLPGWSFYLIGLLKISCAWLLLAGLWLPATVTPAAGLIAGLMLGAIAMHIKVKDPALRSLPALAMLAMCALLLWLKQG